MYSLFETLFTVYSMVLGLIINSMPNPLPLEFPMLKCDTVNVIGLCTYFSDFGNFIEIAPLVKV